MAEEIKLAVQSFTTDVSCRAARRDPHRHPGAQGASSARGGGWSRSWWPTFFRAFSDPTRVDLLNFLRAAGEATGTQCIERAGLF